MSGTIVGFVTTCAVAMTFTTGTSAAAGQQLAESVSNTEADQPVFTKSRHVHNGTPGSSRDDPGTHTECGRLL